MRTRAALRGAAPDRWTRAPHRHHADRATRASRGITTLLRKRCRRFDPAAFGCASVAIGMRATIHDTLIPMRAGGRLGLIALGTYSRSVATAMAGQVSH
jgi:hypothetical protein